MNVHKSNIGKPQDLRGFDIDMSGYATPNTDPEYYFFKDIVGLIGFISGIACIILVVVSFRLFFLDIHAIRMALEKTAGIQEPENK